MPFDRQEGEDTLDWLQRLFEGLNQSQSRDERAPIYEAFFAGLPEDPARLLALRQGVRPDAHETAKPAPENIQADYQGMLERGELSPGEVLPPALAGLFFAGPDGRLYRRDEDTPDPVPWPALLREIDHWRRHDQVQDMLAQRDWPAFLQHLWQQEALLDLQTGGGRPGRHGPPVARKAPRRPNRSPAADADAAPGGRPHPEREKVVIDLFGGETSQLPGAINVDIRNRQPLGIRGRVPDKEKPDPDVENFAPVRDESADEVLAIGPRAPFVREAHRILKVGGTLTIVATKRNRFGKLPDDATLEEIGFRIVQRNGSLPNELQGLTFRLEDGTKMRTDIQRATILEKVK